MSIVIWLSRMHAVRLRRWMGGSIAFAVALFVAGCGHMPVTSMIKLARVDFTTTDPTQLRAAVKLPRAIRPWPTGVALRISVKLANGHEEYADFTLHEASEAADLLELRQEVDAGSHIFAYRLDAKEAARLAGFRDALQKKQAARGGKGGAITIAIRPEACRTGELSGPAIPITTYVRTPETGGYVPLARDVDLRTLSARRDIAAALAPCE